MILEGPALKAHFQHPGWLKFIYSPQFGTMALFSSRFEGIYPLFSLFEPESQNYA